MIDEQGKIDLTQCPDMVSISVTRERNIYNDKVLDIYLHAGLLIGDTINISYPGDPPVFRTIDYFFEENGTIKCRTICGNHADAYWYAMWKKDGYPTYDL